MAESETKAGSALRFCSSGWKGGEEHRHTHCVMVVHAKSLQSYLTLCDTMDCSPPGSSVRGILQARILEWVAMPSSRGSS